MYYPDELIKRWQEHVLQKDSEQSPKGWEQGETLSLVTLKAVLQPHCG